MAAVSFAGTKSSSPTDKDLSDLYYVVDYLRATQDIGHILHKSTMAALRLYCEVGASYLLHPDSKGRTGYNISFYGTTGTFHNRSVKQTSLATSSTHAEARAIFILAKELNFLIAFCQELQIPLELPADNSAIVTMASNDSGYTKKCKHFLMVLNYIKEQIVLGQIEARKIYGKLNTADMHAIPVGRFRTHAQFQAKQGSYPSLYYSPCFGLDNDCGRTCPRNLFAPQYSSCRRRDNMMSLPISYCSVYPLHIRYCMRRRSKLPSHPSLLMVLGLPAPIDSNRDVYRNHWESNLPPRGTFLCLGVTFLCPGVTVLRPRGIFLCPVVTSLSILKLRAHSISYLISLRILNNFSFFIWFQLLY